MNSPHTSCRYAVGFLHGPGGTRTFIGAVHAVDEENVLVSRVMDLERPGDDPLTTYALPVVMATRHLAVMAPNLGEARKVLRYLLAERDGDA